MTNQERNELMRLRVKLQEGLAALSQQEIRAKKQLELIEAKQR